jgi:hypothetical protein
MLCVIDFIDIQLITVYPFMKNICIHLIIVSVKEILLKGAERPQLIVGGSPYLKG